MKQKDSLKKAALSLLEGLIARPSLSKEEGQTAAWIEAFLTSSGVAARRSGNNVWARSSRWEEGRPVLLLNSHHDTVKPAAGWQRDPFHPTWEGDTLYGLGSNDAGASLVALIAAFLYFEQEPIPLNLVLAASAEEEISGPNGIAALLPELGPIDAAVVGEPTQMQMAIAEKGLMVIDGTAYGKSGHAARDEGVNALYIALEDIARIRDFQFEQVSPLLGPVRATVTQIEAGSQHNVVPDRCRFVIDVRTNECYSNQEAFDILQELTRSDLKARSFRLNSSGIPEDHPLVKAGRSMGKSTYGSPTLSDQALMPFPSLKMGVGDSARSHTADEYIHRQEIESGIEDYIRLLELVAAAG